MATIERFFICFSQRCLNVIRRRQPVAGFLSVTGNSNTKGEGRPFVKDDIPTESLADCNVNGISNSKKIPLQDRILDWLTILISRNWLPRSESKLASFLSTLLPVAHNENSLAGGMQIDWTLEHCPELS
jgi:hypothetical protein